MKSIITISLDQEIIKFLKEETNYSDVINEELKARYTLKKIENLEVLNKKLAEIKQNMKIFRKKRRIIEDNIEKITQKEKLFKKKMLSRSKMIKQIEKRRSFENNSHRRVVYYETPEEEVNRILKGGVTNGKKS